jgi:TolA-binding protein
MSAGIKEKMMKRLIMLFLICLAFGSRITHADEQGGTLDFWQTLKNKIASFVLMKSASPTTTSEDLYWKGEASPQTIDPDELEAFKKGIALMDSGEKEQAQTAFSDFITEYPDSSLKKDAKEALAHLTR